jgi:hypothetical protein
MHVGSRDNQNQPASQPTKATATAARMSAALSTSPQKSRSPNYAKKEASRAPRTEAKVKRRQKKAAATKQQPPGT